MAREAWTLWGSGWDARHGGRAGDRTGTWVPGLALLPAISTGR